MTTMPAAWNAKEALIEDLRAPVLLPLSIGGREAPELVQSDMFFHPMQGVEGMCLAHLLAPFGHSALLVKAEAGAHVTRGAVKSAVKISVMQGAAMFYLPERQPDPVLIEAGETLDLAPGEVHGVVITKTYLSYNIFTPAFESVKLERDDD